jgi:hypothetical protein
MTKVTKYIYAIQVTGSQYIRDKEHIPYNLIFTTKCNDSSIFITIISRLFEFVVDELICWGRHNTNPCYQV